MERWNDSPSVPQLEMAKLGFEARIWTEGPVLFSSSGSFSQNGLPNTWPFLLKNTPTTSSSSEAQFLFLFLSKPFPNSLLLSKVCDSFSERDPAAASCLLRFRKKGTPAVRVSFCPCPGLLLSLPPCPQLPWKVPAALQFLQQAVRTLLPCCAHLPSAPFTPDRCPQVLPTCQQE